MSFKAKINGVEVKYKNRFVLEVVKQYIQKNPNITYNELKYVFKDELQGSIGVIKNEDDLKEWEKNKKVGARLERFFINDVILHNSEKIYVCTEWGFSGKNTNGNMEGFINFTKNILKYEVEIYNDNNGATTSVVPEPSITKVISPSSSLDIKNIILYGAPGVGKTHNYQKLISMIEQNRPQKEMFYTISKNAKVELNSDIFKTIKDENRVEFVTFHQSYSYEDFIEGFRPNPHAKIELEDGIFKQLCDKAQKDKEKNYYIVIDEINRANISKVFGELITLIEEDKRDNYEVTLPYSKEPFKIPSNLYIIATMNSTDKSIATIDIALIRRFTFLKMKPDSKLIKNPHAKELFEKLNSFIEESLGEDYKLGHSYFMKIENMNDLEFIKEYKIKPLLEEYFYADDDKLSEVLKVLEEKN